MTKIIIGIDISKKYFDIALEKLDGKCLNHTFSNDHKGVNDLQNWIIKNNLGLVTLAMEATGHYGENLAQSMYDHGHTILVINPAQIKYFGQSKLSRVKTDRKDARLIAEFTRITPHIKNWIPRTKAQKKHCELFRCLVNLKDDRAQYQTRLESARDEEVKALFHHLITNLTQMIKDLEKRISNLISNHEELKKQDVLLQSIPGVGPMVSWGIISEIRDVQSFRMQNN